MFKNRLFSSGAAGVAPRIVLSGENRVLIEKHRGILDYTGDLLTVRLEKGCVSIIGQELQIIEYGALDMIIYGKIRSLEFFNV
ncbi:MAG: YabP/YqfC family sporulation protein [Clostridia bacterium]|nr:YabP/YqfC family sporulation protein [Clostridia bacterium]